jgi:ATP-binding cassette subfamily B protein
MKELQHLNKYLRKYRFKLLIGVLITILAKIFVLFTPRLIGEAINVVADVLDGSLTYDVFKPKLLFKILLVVAAAVIAGIFTFLKRQTIINVSRFIEFDLKNEVYQQYQRLSLNFYKKNRTGDLMNRISEDVGKVRMYVGPAIMYSIDTITLFVIAIIYMVNQSPTLTLYTIMPLPILSIAIYNLSRVIHKRSTIVQMYLSKLSSYAQESFSGIFIIKANGLEAQTNYEFETLSSDSRRKQIDLTKVQAFFFPLMILLIGASNLFVIYIGGLQYINGEIEIGTIAEFIIYVNMLTWPVAALGWVTSIVQQAEASQKRINEFLKEEPDIKNNAKAPTEICGDIEFKNVHFTYEDTNVEALKGVSFNIKQGETLAIIGKTGSGKSTILELMGRLYDIGKGQLKIDGKNIDEIDLNSLRNSIGYVPQDAFLFSDSIKNNIKFGAVASTDDDVISAAKNAVVHKNIMKFVNGYDTVLGERGITLSGGQKQRVSIARAIIKEPKILLLDDCLSAVDTETEEQILNNLDRVSKGKTTVIVSHRISSVKNANSIIVLEDGKIIQEGRHEKLIDSDGYYKDLYLKQLSETS